MLKSSTFTAPTLSEADAEYRSLADREQALSVEYTATKRAIRDLESDITDRPAPAVRPGVAALLGEVVDPDLLDRPARLKEARTRAADLEAAMAIVAGRKRDRVGNASSAACRLARPEYAKRVAKFAAALEAAYAAYQETEVVVDALDREGAQTSYLAPVMVNFFRGADNGCDRAIAEAKGYANA